MFPLNSIGENFVNKIFPDKIIPDKVQNIGMIISENIT